VWFWFLDTAIDNDWRRRTRDSFLLVIIIRVVAVANTADDSSQVVPPVLYFTFENVHELASHLLYFDAFYNSRNIADNNLNQSTIHAIM
jgi:hypothetical protein